MLFMLKSHISKLEGLSNNEFYGVWLKEAEAAVAAYFASGPVADIDRLFDHLVGDRQ
jgi:hypothetical protein